MPTPTPTPTPTPIPTPTPTPTPPTPTPTSTCNATTLYFTDNAQPCFPSGGGSPTNKQSLDNLTCQFAGDFLRWLTIQFDYIFNGVVNVQPNGFIDTIEIDYTGSTSLTRITSAPLNGWPRELGHEDSNCPSFPGSDNIAYGVTTTDVPSGGTGKVQLYKSDKVTTLGKPITVDNTNGWWPTDIPTGTHVIIGRIGCVLQIISAACVPGV